MLAAVVLVPADALADGADVIRDCTRNGELTRKYSADEYRDALATLPADVEEYGDCREIIRDSQLDVASGGDGIGASPLIGAAAATTAPATPQERAAVATAQKEPAAAPIQVGGESVTPGGSATSSGAGGLLNEVPTPLIVVLALLGAAALGAAAWLGARRLHVVGRR
jgi:hypothetical protein